MKTKYIWQIATSIATGIKDEDIQNFLSNSQPKIESEIASLLENRDKVIEILNILFPQGIPTNSDFYAKISDIQYYLGFKPIAKSLTGLLWIEAYKLLLIHDAFRLLNILVEDKNVDIWSSIHSLPIFLSEIELPSDFASIWFFSIGKRVGADLAGGDFYKAIENYGFNFPESGLKVLEKYLSEGLDDIKLHLSAILLGVLRVSSEMGSIQKKVITELDKRLSNNFHLEVRLCYHRSWIVPFWKGILSIDQLEQQLSIMIHGVQEEIAEAYNVLHKCSFNQLTNEVFINFAIRWLKENITNNIPPLAKYNVVNLLLKLCDISMAKERIANIGDANKLIIALQPVPPENIGIWDVIEHYLVDRLREDKKLFGDFLNQLIEANASGLLEQFKSNFSYLKSEMAKCDIRKLIGELLFSPDENQRKLGKILFQEIKIDSLPDEILENLTESQLGIMLWESIRTPFFGSDTSRFFLMLEPLFRKVRPELQEEFIREMVMQAINYPGECLENWERIKNPSDLLKGIIESARKYFENLKTIQTSPANSFAFPEYNQAAEKAGREFSRRISEDVKERSIFTKLAKNVDIIYGSQWSVMIQGNLGEPTPFKEVSHSIEFPRLEVIDPEGMTKRRLHANIKIKHSQTAGYAD